jgi:hypothetical protein
VFSIITIDRHCSVIVTVSVIAITSLSSGALTFSSVNSPLCRRTPGICIKLVEYQCNKIPIIFRMDRMMFNNTIRLFFLLGYLVTFDSVNRFASKSIWLKSTTIRMVEMNACNDTV